MAALVYAFWLPRGRGRACPARGFPISARFPYTSAIYFTMQQRHTSPERSKIVPYKAPVNPICREGSLPLRGRLPDTGRSRAAAAALSQKAAARIPRGASGTPPPTTTCELSHHRSRPRCLRHGIPPADVPRGTSAGLFCWKNPFFIPSVCAIIDASGPKAAKKRKNRGGTAWQKSSQ